VRLFLLLVVVWRRLASAGVGWRRTLRLTTFSCAVLC